MSGSSVRGGPRAGMESVRECEHTKQHGPAMSALNACGRQMGTDQGLMANKRSFRDGGGRRAAGAAAAAATQRAVELPCPAQGCQW